MTGDELKRLRERRGLDRGELAELLNGALDKSYSAETVARWERGSRAVSKAPATFLEELALAEFAGADAGELGTDDAPLPPSDVVDDTAPGPGPTPQPPLVSGGGLYVRACEELWEMIATGVGMMGAVLNSPALMNDGAIIAGDKEALGAAWGKLAQTNETFRRMLAGMTEGGAWLQVAMVTGTTFSNCWQNHTAYKAHVRQQQPVDAPPADGPVPRDHLADAAA